jgi:pyruvate kinase
MLESMVQNPQPTRAEANDVANAIHDGTDAIMLSAETAVGNHPEAAVQMMDRIARTMEADSEYQRLLREQHPTPRDTTADAVSLAACDMAYNLGAKVIVTFTQSGSTALQVARNRYPVPILAITPEPRVYRQLSMAWGIMPMMSEIVHNTDEMVAVANRCILESGMAAVGERYLVTAGVPFGIRGTTNMIRVERVQG